MWKAVASVTFLLMVNSVLCQLPQVLVDNKDGLVYAAFGDQFNPSNGQWADISGNNNHANRLTSSIPKLMDFKNGGKTFKGWRMTAGNGVTFPMNVYGYYTIFIVDRYTPLGNYRGRGLQSRVGYDWFLGLWNQQRAHYAQGWMSYANTHGYSQAPTQWAISVGVFGSDGVFHYYHNGQRIASQSGYGYPGHLRYGSADGSTCCNEHSDNDVASMIMYNKALNQDQIKKILQFLMEKYGISSVSSFAPNSVTCTTADALGMKSNFPVADLRMFFDATSYDPNTGIWSDRSQCSNASTVASSAKPTLVDMVSRGKTFKAVHFETNNWLRFTDLAVGNPSTFLLVDRYTPGGTSRGRLINSLYYNWYTNRHGGFIRSYMNDWVPAGISEPYWWESVTDWGIGTSTFDQPFSNVNAYGGRMYFNGQSRDPGGNRPGRELSINTNDPSQGDVALIAVWDRVLTDAERIAMELAVAERFGLPHHNLNKMVAKPPVPLDPAVPLQGLNIALLPSGYNAATGIWSDASGNQHHAISTTTSKPTLVNAQSHGLTFPVVHFETNNNLLLNNGLGTPSTFTIVSRYTPGASNRNRIISGRENTNIWVGHHGGYIRSLLGDSWLGGDSYAHVTHSGSAFTIHTVVYDDTKANPASRGFQASLYFNSEFILNNGPYPLNTLGVNTVEPSQSDIAAIFAWDRALNDTERLTFENYLINTFKIKTLTSSFTPVPTFPLPAKYPVKDLALMYVPTSYDQTTGVWNDISGNGYDGYLDSKLSAVSSDNVRVVRFETNNFMTISNLSLHGAFTMMTVERYPPTGGTQRRSLQSRETNFVFNLYYGRRGWYADGWNPHLDSVSFRSDIYSYGIATASVGLNSRTSFRNPRWYYNSNMATGDGGYYFSRTPGSLIYNSPNEPSRVELAAMAIWERQLSDDERAIAEAFFSAFAGFCPLKDGTTYRTRSCSASDPVNNYSLLQEKTLLRKVPDPTTKHSQPQGSDAVELLQTLAKEKSKHEDNPKAISVPNPPESHLDPNSEAAKSLHLVPGSSTNPAQAKTETTVVKNAKPQAAQAQPNVGQETQHINNVKPPQAPVQTAVNNANAKAQAQPQAIAKPQVQAQAPQAGRNMKPQDLVQPKAQAVANNVKPPVQAQAVANNVKPPVQAQAVANNVKPPVQAQAVANNVKPPVQAQPTAVNNPKHN